VDDLGLRHARIYAATYLTPAVGAWMVRGGATPDELRALAASMIVLAAAALLAVPLSAGFVAINVAPVLAGAGLVFSAARASAPAATTA
jgi:hypothetical protein